MEITEIDSFKVQLAPDAPDDFRITSLGITRVRTDQGITGYGFRGTSQDRLQQIRPRLIGKSPLDIERYLVNGILDHCPSLEHALWDIAGKAANMPTRHLWGNTSETIDYYLTCVWPGEPDQSHLSIEQQAEDMIRLYQEHGHTRFKIRGWRQDPLDDVRVFEYMRKVIGGRDKLEVMIDRTAQHPGWIWTYEQALSVARALEDIDANWLEEPFERTDLASYRRLKDEVDLPITGAEFGKLEVHRDYLVAGAVDIVQPDGSAAGGIWPCRKIAAMADAFGVPTVLHGTQGPDLAASLQAAGAIDSCYLMEVCIMRPPLSPAEMWAPCDQILKSPGLYKIHDGLIELPTIPGNGVDVDDAAIERLRVR